MNYEKFCEILNKHIFENEKAELLRKIANSPERFIGLFRPTKPSAKILQYLFQSHEIKMGDAFEEIIEEIIKQCGFEILPKGIENEKGEPLSLDQYFTDKEKFYFIEQKIRDDHDSTKKRGQLSNFETKLEILQKRHGSRLIGIMYFIDPDFSKNKAYYSKELEKLKKFYKVDLYIFYGEELFYFLKCPEMWKNILLWLEKWKNSLPELPQINFDENPEISFEELKNLELRTWRKIVENDKLWEEGIIKAIFNNGSTLRHLVSYFKTQQTNPYEELAKKLTERLNKYY